MRELKVFIDYSVVSFIKVVVIFGSVDSLTLQDETLGLWKISKSKANVLV